MKVFFIFMVFVTGNSANAISLQDNFDLGCHPWNQVQEEYDLSQISYQELADLHKAHSAARTYFLNANENFSHYSNADLRFKKIMLCALADEATYGFEYQCIGEAGQELFGHDLIDGCQAIRLPDDLTTPLRF